MVDAIDAKGRRYEEVLGRPRWERPWDPREACEECGRRIVHGARFYMRNEPTDGKNPNMGSLANIVMALTYDLVCAECGDRILEGVYEHAD